MSTYYSPYPTNAPACYRHPDRPALVGCSRCGRPACPECMYSAAVGQQCADCVQAAYAVPTTQVPAGAPVVRGGKPWITYGLIAINVLMFVLVKARPELGRDLSLWPIGVANGQYYRLVTSVFMHYALMHIGFNMWALYVLGPPLEEYLGRWRYLALYAVSGLGGSVMVYFFSPVNVPTIGASGAIYGLFGATLVAARRLRLDVRWLVTLIAINLAMTFTIPGISWQGHIGGLITGAAIAAVYVFAPRANRTMVQIGATCALLVLFAVLTYTRTETLRAAGYILTSRNG